MKNIFSSKLITIIFILSVVANLAFLDFFVFHSIRFNKVLPFQIASESNVVSPQVSSNKEPVTAMCPATCLSQIYQATSSISLKPQTEDQTTTIIGGSKEFYIPFGSGQSTAYEWTDVPGIQAYIDTSQYSSINTVTFEAAIHIPTGNQFAQARLFNVTGNHVVWNSDVYIEGGTPQLLISQPITLDQGRNLYQVQMQTQLQAPAILDSARVHIITN